MQQFLKAAARLSNGLGRKKPDYTSSGLQFCECTWSLPNISRTRAPKAIVSISSEGNDMMI